MPLTILCIATYRKGDDFLRECRRRGCRVLLLTDETLAELIARSEAAGARQMLAVIGDSANTSSIALHAALGFSRSGVLKSAGWKFGRWLDVVLMQRQLGLGDTVEAAD